MWNDIFCILGFCSVWAVALRCASYDVLSPFMACANMCSSVCGSWFIMLMSLFDIGSSRGLLFFDGVMFSVFCSVDRSIHFSFTASDIRTPVSLSVCSSVAMRFPHDAISRSISVSVGMKGILASIFMVGFVHLSPRYLSSAAYVSRYLLFDRVVHFCDRMVSLTCSVSIRFVVAASCLSACVREWIVVSASPLFLMWVANSSRSLVAASSMQVALESMLVDFNLPKRFNVTYTGADNKEHEVVMIHRALLGAIERFFGILLEHCSGNLPTWLAPVQALVIPVSDYCLEYAESVRRKLVTYGIRAELDDSTSTVSYKIRNAELQKIPYMAIIGKHEAETGRIAVRRHGTGNLGSLTIEELARHVRKRDKR